MEPDACAGQDHRDRKHPCAPIAPKGSAPRRRALGNAWHAFCSVLVPEQMSTVTGRWTVARAGRNTWRAHLKSGVASALSFMAIIAGCTPDGEDASAPLGDDDVSHSLPEPEETILPLREAVGGNPYPGVWLSPSPDVPV